MTALKNPGPNHSIPEGLVRKHRPALLRYFQRKGFRLPDDEDATQEVLTRLVCRLGLADEVKQVDSYLFATAANVATDLRRKGRVRAAERHDAYDDALHERATDLTPETIFSGRQALAITILALKNFRSERARCSYSPGSSLCRGRRSRGG